MTKVNPPKLLIFVIFVGNALPTIYRVVPQNVDTIIKQLELLQTVICKKYLTSTVDNIKRHGFVTPIFVAGGGVLTGAMFKKSNGSEINIKSSVGIANF